MQPQRTQGSGRFHNSRRSFSNSLWSLWKCIKMNCSKRLDERIGERLMSASSRFVYVIYIRTTLAELWEALFEPEFTRQFWVETWQESTWEVGASWKLMLPDGRVGDAGEVLEIVPEKRLVLSWQN